MSIQRWNLPVPWETQDGAYVTYADLLAVIDGGES